MARLKACSVCGKIHDANIRCMRAVRADAQAHSLRQTNKWHTKSLEIRERSHWLCAVCLDNGIINHESLEVHHIEKLRDNPSGLLEDENLICLCTTHHKLADEGQIDADELRKAFKKSPFFTEVYLHYAREIIDYAPTVDPKSEVFEWCHNCKEYDQKQHCCHRWSSLIRKTVEELKQERLKVKWIPINEKTIKILQDHHYYLVAHKDFKTPMKAKYHNDSFKHFEVLSFKSSQISYIFLNSTDDITHFMELPELPKEEEGEK